METQSPAPQTKVPTPPGHTRVIFQNLQLVLGVAFILASLFTIWTPGESNNNPGWEITQLGTLPTLQPTSNPTLIAPAKPLIGIVAGHSGHDSGSVCFDGLTEVDVNQNIANLVQKELISLGYEVDLLQEFDNRLTNYKGLVLVSIHADSCDYINDQATGYKVAAALASPNPEKSARLSACIRSRYGQVTGLPLHSTSVTRDMTDYHAFSEIDPSTVAAIIETGFLNLDRSFLTEKPGIAAQGIVDGILCYLNNEDISNKPDTMISP